ncbi:MAG TPA: glycoside hydrolase domain-containing protein [Solirubrobacteraceae bacterium]|nr:glycoside hydrolase domain-containing protein [Solirubrobacteraceae bacterium]
MRRCSIFAFRWISAAALVAVLGLAATCSTAASAQVVRFHGYRLSVPAGWPVYQLARRPRTCVRFDRHAVYLGTPSSAQTCPAHAVGRTESVLISPVGRAGLQRAAASVNGAAGLAGSGGSVDRVTLGYSGLVATATWSSDRRVVAHILRHRVAATRPAHLSATARAAGAPQAHAAGAVFTGLGFDACSAPSTTAMSAWSQSPFRVVGVYIGGLNSTCAQPNLTPGWVSGEVAAGWHLIPTYVGYQGAGACGGTCATINPTQAAGEGAAAASDAVSRAQALGIPGGNPIYDDLEQYARSTANTAAVLAFLSGWTTQLHAAGYQSGVYSSASSAITDLVNQQGTGYHEPDDIWIGDWNNKQSTSDPYVPAGDWSSHARVHQYQGAHNDSYGGVTLNVDSDYVDGATADTGGANTATPVVPDGTFVQEAGSTDVYRVAGGAPMLVTSWAPYGSPQPVTTLSVEQFAQLRAYPADGTFVQTTTEMNYRFAGGAPFAVSSWSVFGGIQPYVVVDEWNIENAGNPLSHVAVTPADGTVVQGLPSNSDWLFCSGQRTPVPANAKAVEVDDAGLAAFAPGTNSACATVRGAGALQGKVLKHCVVPRLKHMTLARARRTLLKANCRVGKVQKPGHVKRHHTLRVFGQSAKVRSQHVVRYRVNLRLI